MEEENYKAAGWAAIASALLFVLAFGLLLYDDLGKYPTLNLPGSPVNILPMVILLDAISKVLLIYAWLRFRTLLNQPYQFHAIDTLIVVLLVGGVLLGAVSYLGRGLPELKVPVAVTGAIMAVTLGIIGIVTATRLLRLNGDLGGMLKPLAYTFMAASICFALVILTPVGLVLEVAVAILLGVTLLRGHEEPEQIEIV